MGDYITVDDIPKVEIYKLNQINSELTDVVLDGNFSEMSIMTDDDGYKYVYANQRITGIIAESGDIIYNEKFSPCFSAEYTPLGYYNGTVVLGSDQADTITFYKDNTEYVAKIPNNYLYNIKNTFCIGEKLFLVTENADKKIPARNNPQSRHGNDKLFCIDIVTGELAELYETSEYIASFDSEYVWVYDGNKTLKKYSLADKTAVVSCKLDVRPKNIHLESCNGKIFVWDEYDNSLISVIGF